jgi:hypothetical protein
MSVNVQTSLDQHGLTADEQMAVFAYMNRSQQVNAYEVQQHIAVCFESDYSARVARVVARASGRAGDDGRAFARRVSTIASADADADVAMED